MLDQWKKRSDKTLENPSLNTRNVTDCYAQTQNSGQNYIAMNIRDNAAGLHTDLKYAMVIIPALSGKFGHKIELVWNQGHIL